MKATERKAIAPIECDGVKPDNDSDLDGLELCSLNGVADSTLFLIADVAYRTAGGEFLQSAIEHPLRYIAEMLKRLAALRASAERRWKDEKGLLKTIDDLHDDAAKNARHFKMALYIADKDKQSLLSTIERLRAENARLQKENERAKSDCWFSMLWEENERLSAE